MVGACGDSCVRAAGASARRDVPKPWPRIFAMCRSFGSGRTECSRYKQIIVFGIARSRRERDRTRDAEISYSRKRLIDMGRQYESLSLLGLKSVELPSSAERPGGIVVRRPSTGRNRRLVAGLSGIPPDCADPRSAADCAQDKAANSVAQGPHGLFSTAGLLNGVFGSGDRCMSRRGRPRSGSSGPRRTKMKRSSSVNASSSSMSWP